jgi:hypothetical protein
MFITRQLIKTKPKTKSQKIDNLKQSHKLKILGSCPFHEHSLFFQTKAGIIKCTKGGIKCFKKAQQAGKLRR